MTSLSLSTSFAATKSVAGGVEKTPLRALYILPTSVGIMRNRSLTPITFVDMIMP